MLKKARYSSSVPAYIDLRIHIKRVIIELPNRKQTFIQPEAAATNLDLKPDQHSKAQGLDLVTDDEVLMVGVGTDGEAFVGTLGVTPLGDWA